LQSERVEEKAPSPRGGWIRAEREDWGIVDVAITFMYSGTSFAVVAYAPPAKRRTELGTSVGAYAPHKSPTSCPSTVFDGPPSFYP